MVVEETDAASVQRVERVEERRAVSSLHPSPKVTFVNPGRFLVAKQQRILYKIPIFV